MEAILPILFLGLLFYIGVRVIRFLSFQQSCNRAFVRVGQQYNGKAPNGGVKYSWFFSRPSLTFPYRDTFCQLRVRRSSAFGTNTVTEFRIHSKGDLPNFEITTDQLRHFKAANIGVSVDKNVQKNFKIATESPTPLGKLMTNPVCWQLEQLRRHQSTDQVAITCRRGELHIKKPGVMVEFQVLDDFVRFALQLYDQMLLAKAQGIEFVNDDTAAVIDDVICPICSEEITQDMVVCIRCKTPHCRDCWEYNGQCATFACGETRFLRVG